MISTDVKANKTTRNKRSGGRILQIFIRNTLPSNLEIKLNKGIDFSFDFSWYSIHLDIVD